MTGLGKKLEAIKKLEEIINNIISNNIDESIVQELNGLFFVFNKNFILEKQDIDYQLKDAQELYTKCLSIVKKEYSRVFMQSISLTNILQEEDEE